MPETNRLDFVRCAPPCLGQAKHTLVPGECWLGEPDLSQPCPDPDCVEDNDALSDCCWGRGCRCEQAREDASYSEVADYLDDGTVQRWCGTHRAEWIDER